MDGDERAGAEKRPKSRADHARPGTGGRMSNLRDDMDGDGMVERRRHERVTATVAVHVSWPDNGTVIGETLNVSRGGILVDAGFDPPPPVGTRLLVRMALPQGGVAPLPVAARVARTVGGTGLALAFVGP